VTATALSALVLIALGALARRFGVLRSEDGRVLVNVVLYLAMPALIVDILLEAHLDASLLLVPVAAFLIHFALLGICLGGAKATGRDDRTTGAIMVSGAVGNTGFFGLPLIAASGAGFSLAAAVMYDALATAFITWTSTVVIATVYGGRAAAGNDLLRGVGRALALPPMWALGVGLVLNLGDVPVPSSVERLLEILGAATLPLVMIYAGVAMHPRGMRRAWAEVSAITVVRLAIAPAIALAIAVAFGFGGDVLRTVVIMAAMPTAMMSLVLGTMHGLRSDVIAGAVLATTLLATLTLPALRGILT
jgi:predicted permease